MFLDIKILPQAGHEISNRTKLSFIGIAGSSFINLDDRDKKIEDIATPKGQDLKTGSDLLLGGLNLYHQASYNTKYTFSFSVISSKMNTTIDKFDLKTKETNRYFNDVSTENKYSFWTEMSTHNLSKNFLKAGLRWDTFDVKYEVTFISDEYEPNINTTNSLSLLRAYIQDAYTFSPQWKATLGIHSQYLFLNNSFALEPRAAVQYKISDKKNSSSLRQSSSNASSKHLFLPDPNTKWG